MTFVAVRVLIFLTRGAHFINLWLYFHVFLIRRDGARESHFLFNKFLIILRHRICPRIGLQPAVILHPVLAEPQFHLPSCCSRANFRRMVLAFSWFHFLLLLPYERRSKIVFGTCWICIRALVRALGKRTVFCVDWYYFICKRHMSACALAIFI